MDVDCFPSELISKYAVPGPRYTSYPTALEFTPIVNESEWIRSLERELEGPDRTLALYVHIPFCASLCYFCACNKVIATSREVVAPFIESLKAEIALYRKVLGSSLEVRQLHWGGGSPTYLEPAEIDSIFTALIDAFPNISSEAELSVEIDPRTTSEEKLKTLRAIGFNRISLGVQDFNPRVQEIIHRHQPKELTKSVYEMCRTLGFKSINVDLIYGLPEQTKDSLEETVNEVIALRPDRIALYGYAHVPWSTKVQNVFRNAHLPTPEERILLLQRAVQLFEGAGYNHIGMDHFALRQDELTIAQEQRFLQRNFMGYTTQKSQKLLGLGPSAISSIPACMAQNFKELEPYQVALKQGRFPIERGVLRKKEDLIRGAIIHDLFCHRALDIPACESVWNIDFWDKFDPYLPELKKLASDGVIEFDRTQIKVTKRGKFFLRNIGMVFDEYLHKHQVQTGPSFSQAV